MEKYSANQYAQALPVTLLKKVEKERKMPLEDDESEFCEITRLKMELETSLARNDSMEKENQELKQEVARLKAHISSLKAHDNERKSMLWKKLHNSSDNSNTDPSPQKSSDFMKVLEQSSEAENVYPRPSFQELNKVNAPSVPVPPPPPLPSKLLAGFRSVRRVPEVVDLYRSLTRKDANMENKTNATTTPELAFTRNMIGEIENRSTYVSAIKSDVQKQKEFINFLISEVQSASFKDISDVEVFVKWLDQELSSLVDERAVLKHFPQWPERKADALREAAFSYRDLKNLEAEVSSFEVNPRESFNSELRRMQALQDRLEQSVNNIERITESTNKRYRDFQIPCEWMLDHTGLFGQMKFSSLRLAREYMKRTIKELQSNEASQESSLLLQGVRFAYRVHQFAGGFDAETTRAFEDLKKICNLGSTSYYHRNANGGNRGSREKIQTHGLNMLQEIWDPLCRRLAGMGSLQRDWVKEVTSLLAQKFENLPETCSKKRWKLSKLWFLLSVDWRVLWSQKGNSVWLDSYGIPEPKKN
ncbi:protein CHUP1, chloroplastic-like [Durio zibethinus]|uniref:Protein CHUP1, chloroplastic-like n=1 Tax=Durio zibethinus TaxID=66656 RepID=A0A6P5ZMJ5_DURZI|nr:protein CHUP1, chloroplastic-like [Durio zibethinus]